MIAIYIGENGVRFKIVKDANEAEFESYNGENWQIITESELPVISENISDIQNELIEEAKQKQEITAQEKIRRGQLIVKMLKLKRLSEYKDQDDRYNTIWGTKTVLGIFETVKRLLTDDIDVIEKVVNNS